MHVIFFQQEETRREIKIAGIAAILNRDVWDFSCMFQFLKISEDLTLYYVEGASTSPWSCPVSIITSLFFFWFEKINLFIFTVFRYFDILMKN